jgi:hypothetical protein
MIVHEQQRKVGEEVAQERGRSGGGRLERRQAGRQQVAHIPLSPHPCRLVFKVQQL